MRPKWRHAVGFAAVVLACGGEQRRASTDPGEPPAGSLAPAGPAVDLIDQSIPPATAGEGGWNYQQAADADLNGNGAMERVVLTAQVEVIRGRPAWDDGQAWQVYIEDSEGRRTHVYARRLQLGTLTMRLTRAAAGLPATVVLLEHLPDQLSLYEIAYSGPAAVTASVPFQRGLDPRGEVASPRLP